VPSRDPPPTSDVQGTASRTRDCPLQSTAGGALGHVAVQLARDHALDRLAPLPGQQPLSVGGEGDRLVASPEQGPEALQVGLQRGLEPEQVVSGQLRGQEWDCGHDGTPWAESDPDNLSRDFPLQ
jgi:hypothetical protein